MPFERPATVNEPSDKFPAQSFAVRDGSKTLDFDLSALAIDGNWTFPAPGSADSGKYLKGDGTWTTVSGLSPITNNLILGNISGSTALPVGITASNVLDTITNTRGNIVFRDASGWSALAVGTTGQLLRTNGAAADPSWANLATILDLIGSTQGQILFRGASGWGVLSAGTAGQVLQTGGAGADPSWATLGSVVLKSKTGGESVTSSVVVQDDDHLNFNIPANQTWRAVYELYVTTGATTNLRTKFLVPSGASATVSVFSRSNNDHRLDEFSDATVENVHTYNNSSTSTAPHMTRIFLRVVNGANAGTVTFQWAQGTSSATSLTVRSLSGLTAGRET
jgi:hypothetical protein